MSIPINITIICGGTKKKENVFSQGENAECFPHPVKAVNF